MTKMLLNQKLPAYLLGKYQLIGTVTFSVLFALVFLNLYIPFSETAWFSLGNSVMFLHTLVYAAVGRGIFYPLPQYKKGATWWTT